MQKAILALANRLNAVRNYIKINEEHIHENVK